MPGFNVNCINYGPIWDRVQICASVSDATPTKYSTVWVYGRLLIHGYPVLSQPMFSTWYYRTTSPTCDGRWPNAEGVASCSRSIGNAASGYTVRVAVSIGEYSVDTSFTPH